MIGIKLIILRVTQTLAHLTNNEYDKYGIERRQQAAYCSNNHHKSGSNHSTIPQFVETNQHVQRSQVCSTPEF